MSNDLNHERDSDPAVRRAIRAAAQRLARGPAFRPQDAEDLEQELTVTYMLRRASYDAVRGEPGAFVHSVLTRAAIDLCRRRRAACRDPDRLELAALELLPEDHPGPEGQDAVLDARAVLDGLTAEDGELLLAHADRQVASLAKRRGVSARPLRERARALLNKLRELFSDPGAGSFGDALA